MGEPTQASSEIEKEYNQALFTNKYLKQEDALPRILFNLALGKAVWIALTLFWLTQMI